MRHLRPRKRKNNIKITLGAHFSALCNALARSFDRLGVPICYFKRHHRIVSSSSTNATVPSTQTPLSSRQPAPLQAGPLARQKVQPERRTAPQPQPLSHTAASTLGAQPPQTPDKQLSSVGRLPYPLIPSATLECVTRCLTLSATTLVEKLPPQDGTFPDERNGLLGTLHQYRMCIRCYTIYII